MKNPNRSDVERRFSPIHWGYTAMNPDKAYMAECPTLISYEQMYGNGAASDWIYIQVLALFGSSSNKDKSAVDGIGLFASSFAAEVKTYKLSELMLFFSRYKAGKYDNSYYSFDAKRIGNAFFKEFLPQRNNEIGLLNDKLAQERYLKNMERPADIPDGYNTYSWYEECKRRGTIPNPP